MAKLIYFLSLLFLTKFCTFSLNIDSILLYTEVASVFQSETLTVFTVTSTNSMNKLVTHWTLVSAWWLLTNHTVNFLLSFFSTVSSEVSLVWCSSSSFLSCWLASSLSSLSRPLFSLLSFSFTTTTRRLHHGISSQPTRRYGCLKTASTRKFAFWLFL